MGGKGVRRVRFTAEIYAQLVDAFRKRPGDAIHAAAQTGLSVMTASRAWRGDLTAIHPWAEAIEAVLQREGKSALALLALPVTHRVKPGTQPSARRIAAIKETEEALKMEEMEAERLAYITQLAAEKKMIISTRDLTQVNFDMLAEFGVAVKRLAQRYIKQLAEDQEEVSGREVISVMREFNAMTSHSVKCAQVIQGMMRLDRGQSTENVAVRVSPELSMEDAQDIVLAAIDEVRALGLEEEPELPALGAAKEEDDE